jgi:hypothetical protein
MKGLSWTMLLAGYQAFQYEEDKEKSTVRDLSSLVISQLEACIIF